MAFKPITVNTAASEPAHILAEDDAALYAGIIGGDCVLPVGSLLKATVQSNNKVRVSDGAVVVGGHVGRIIKGDYEDLTIANGASGVKRNDIIAARFIAGSDGGADSYSLVVIKGTAAATATDPVVVKGDLYAGDKQRDYPLWRVKIEGLSIVKVEQMYEVGTTNKDLSNMFTELNSKITVSKYDKTALNFKSAWEIRHCEVHKIGSLVHISARIYTGTIMANIDYTIATAGTGFRPVAETPLCAVAGDYSMANTVACMCLIQTSGNILLKVPADGKTYIDISGTFITV